MLIHALNSRMKRHRQPLPNNDIDGHFQTTLAQAPQLFWFISEQFVSWTGDLLAEQYHITLFLFCLTAALIFIWLFVVSTLAGNNNTSHFQTTLSQAQQLFWFISKHLVSWTGDLFGQKNMLYYFTIHLDRICNYFLTLSSSTGENIAIRYVTALTQAQLLL